jgi:hypothetical protein
MRTHNWNIMFVCMTLKFCLAILEKKKYISIVSENDAEWYVWV